LSDPGGVNRVTSFARSPFGSAALGGLIVGGLCWIAIAAGWIASPDSDAAAAPALAASVSDPDETKRGLTVNEIYDRTSAGVAFIEATGGGDQPALPEPFGGPGPAPQRAATGSGFVTDDDGHVITNAHVVDGADEIDVTLGDDEETYDAELVGQDDSTDIAVLKIDAPADQLEPLELGDSSALDVGDPVVAIGNPFGLDRTVTAGIVSALQRQITAPNGFTISDVVQTDAPINPGNSGGPLLDVSGAVVGVNSQIESSGGGNVGIGFAVPIDTAREVAQQLIADGEVQHAFLGITGADLEPQIAEVLNLDADSGALVQDVVRGSPADDAGIEAGDATVSVGGGQIRAGGDLIVAVDGERVKGMDDVIAAVDSLEPGDEIELTLVRDGEERTETVTLDERPAAARQ
jgi:S1-C subfamily serine protease